MMSAASQTPYRAARRAFIAACEAAHVDTVARLHPTKGPDGKPLFMDCAARGPRRATKAVLVVAEDAAGCAMLTAFLGAPLSPDAVPPDFRLVLVHTLDPAAFAGVAGEPGWPAAMLGAVATEDLSRVRKLAVLALGGRGEELRPVLQARLPEATIKFLAPGTDIGRAMELAAAFFKR
jgi:hypothetical protein